MSSNVSPNFGANDLPGSASARSLSIALIGPDKRKRKTVATALAENHQTNVREFESYPKQSDEFRWLIEQSFDVVVFDLDSDPETVLDLLERVRASDSATTMVYSEQADTKLAVRYMRAGAREFLLLPLEDGIVAEALDRVAAGPSQKTQPAHRAAGNLLVFVCAKGGCGVTTMACNLAVALAGDTEQKTLLIDLAVPMGDAALALGITGRYSTEDAIRNADRLDASLLKELLVRHQSGAFVLAAPSNVVGLEDCGDAIDKLILVARREFDHVIVDVGSRMDLTGTTLFKKASTVYLVTLTGVSELRNSNRLISQFFPAGGPNLEVVINRFENRLLGGVNEDVVAKALGRPVRWTAPEDREAAREMQFGVTGAGDTRISRLTLEMAGAITGRAVPQEKKKGFSLKGLGRSVADKVTANDDPLSIKFESPAVSRGTPEIPPAVTRSTPDIPPVVTRDTPDISWPAPAPIANGVALSSAQLNATASVAGTLVYTPGPGSVLPAGTHRLSVVFTPADSESYTTAQATVPLDVKSMPVMAWPTPDPIPYGTALGIGQLRATASVPGRFDYSPAPGAVLAAGTHTLSVEFTPTEADKYAKNRATVSLTVAKATPVVRWPAQKSIDFGARLSAAQLCATALVPGEFDYSPAPGAALAAGTHTLSVKFTPTDTQNYAAVDTNVEIIVTRAAPVIVWSSPDRVAFGTQLSEKQLCARASVNGRFDYSPAPGALLAAGTHTLSVTFTPADAENYATVEANVQLIVGRDAPVIAWPAPDPVPYGAGLSGKQLCATASIPGRFDYSPAPGAVLAAGTHTLSVTFTPADSENYAKAQATVSLNVLKVTPTLEWPALKQAYFGTRLSEKQLCATASVPGRFDYSPGPGQSLAVGTHTLSVTFIPADSTNYATAQAAVRFTVVAKATPVIAWPNPDPITYGAQLSGKHLCATASVPGTFHYSARPGDVLAAGTNTVSATFTPADSENYAEVQASVSLKVDKAMPGIDWAAPKPILEGKQLGAAQLCATSPVPGRFDYTPHPGAALPPGTHTLSVIFNPTDSANYATAQAAVPLTVVAKAIPSVAWPKPAPIPYATALSPGQLCATASVPGRFDYSPGPGVMLAAGTHTLSVTFTPSDAENYAKVEATAPLRVDRATPVLAWPNPDPVPYGARLSAKQLCATASIPGIFDYSARSGEVLAAGTHTLSATFTPTDTANYTTAQTTASIEVTRATPAIEWPAPGSIQSETPLGDAELCATSPVPGSFNYVPGRGHVLPVGAHTLSVTFKPNDTANYNTTQATVSIKVIVKPKPDIVWSNPDPIPFGTPLSTRQLCATASVPGTFHYSADPGEVLPAGTHPLSVTFIPGDKANYATAQATVSLEVEKATPNIYWPAPKPIKPGTPLSDLQLDAAAWVPGKFVYTPAADEVLPAGTHTLSVTFTPADRANYLTAQATVMIRVVSRDMPVITWSTPNSIVQGTALGAAQLCATASVPGTFTYSPAPGEVLAPGMHTLSATFLPSDAEKFKSAQATVALQVEASPATPKLPAGPKPEEIAEAAQDSGVVLKWPKAGDAKDQAKDEAKDEAKDKAKNEVRPSSNKSSSSLSIRPQPIESDTEDSDADETHGAAKKKWIIVAACACPILLVAFLVPLFHSGTKSVAKGPAAPVPVATDTQTNPNEPSSQTQTANGGAVATAPGAVKPSPEQVETPTPAQAKTPTQVQAEMMHNQLSAPARIQQNQQSSAPPPASFSTAGMGGSGAMGNVFNGSGPHVVAAQRGPLAISASTAMALLIQKKLPVYPMAANQMHMSGTVQLDVTISKAGTIEEMHVVSGPVIFRQSALDAVRTWRYKPYLLDNEPIEVKTTIKLSFSLGG